MKRDPWTGEDFVRIVGARSRPPVGEAPSLRARDALATMAHYRTRVPKGIVLYRSHAEMDADRLRWTVEAMVERSRDG